MTRFGMKEKEMEEIALLLADAIRGKKVIDQVKKLRGGFTKINYI